MENKQEAKPLSFYKDFQRAYTFEEFIGELKTLLDTGLYEDFMFIGVGKKIRSMRFGSKDPKQVRFGDLLYIWEMGKQDILDVIEGR